MKEPRLSCYLSIVAKIKKKKKTKQTSAYRIWTQFIFSPSEGDRSLSLNRNGRPRFGAVFEQSNNSTNVYMLIQDLDKQLYQKDSIQYICLWQCESYHVLSPFLSIHRF